MVRASRLVCCFHLVIGDNMSDIFANIFNDLKGAYDDVAGFFDRSLEEIGILDDDEDESSGSVSEASLTAFSPSDKSNLGVSTSEGQVREGPGVSAGDSRSISSVNMRAIEQQWLYRLREFSKIDGGK